MQGLRHYRALAVSLALTTAPTTVLADEPAPEAGDQARHQERGREAEQMSPRPEARAQAEGPAQRLALGLELGEASGATLGYTWLDRHEVSGLVGYSLMYQSLIVRSDYVYRFYRWVPSSKYGVLLTFFGGGGARLGFFEPRPRFLREPRFALGARVPVGVAASMPPFPAELCASLAPGADVLPTLRFRMEGGVGLRFYVDP